MKFSIIVPMHNAAATIGRALESVKKQRFADYEVILVDDGSDDEFDIPNIALNGVFVYQHNQGAGAARNRGLMNAKGEYVLFLDADDELAGGNVLGEFAESTAGYDAVCAGVLELGNGYHTYRSALDMGSACGVAYRREFLRQNDIWFPEIPQMEDVAFNQLVECCGGQRKGRRFEAYLYHVDSDRPAKERYKLTALQWIVRANTYVFNRLYPRDINLAYTQTVRHIGFIYYYMLGAWNKLTEAERGEFWNAVKEWNMQTRTLSVIETVKPFADYFVKCQPGNKQSAENIVGAGAEIMTVKEFFETVLGREWRSAA